MSDRGRARDSSASNVQPDGLARRPPSPSTPPVPTINGADGHGALNVQGALEPRRPEPSSTNGARVSRSHTPAVRTRPADNFVKLGRDGVQMMITSNYFELTSRPDFHLRQYRVDFSPEIDHQGVRKALVRVHEEVLGKYVFDGTLLYNTNRLREPLELLSIRKSDGVEVRVTFRLVGEILKEDHVYNTVMNIIFRRCLAMLNLTMMKRNFFDMPAAQQIPDHKLTVVPGYFTTVHHHEDGYLLGVEIIHKVLRRDTAMDVMVQARQNCLRQNSGADFKPSVKAALEGQVVITPYNNKTYRVDEVDFDKTPMTTFHLRKENKDITYAEYFKSKYNVVIKSMTQPLLMSRPSRRDLNRGDDQPIYLIPELSGMTGLSDDQRSNFQLMKAVGEVTKMNPLRRVESLMNFRQRIGGTATIQEELSSWGLGFANHLVQIPARILPAKMIVQSTSYQAQNGDWSRYVQRNRYCVSVELRKWVIVYPESLATETKSFIKRMMDIGLPHGFQMPVPVMIELVSERTPDYLKAIRDEWSKEEPIDLVVVVLRTSRADVYSAVKKLTLCDLGIVTQVLTGRILRGDDRKLTSVATKVTIQVASKRGAEPWRVQLPNTKWMVVGFDVYHDKKQSRSVGGFVASMNPSFTRYYSSVDLHKNNEEISPSFMLHMEKALKAFYKNNGVLPQKIIVYRDGLGAGDTQRVKETEIAAIKDACARAAKITGKEEPTIAFIVVSKRINTRFFKQANAIANNVDCGTVIDNKVTLNERYDFFLVSQKTTQGTASPTNYNIVEDNTGIPPDVHHKLANCLTDVYYNWAGSLRVPAPVQYAHKLAYLVGESGLGMPNELLALLPYYL